jgi:hypothetical protein
MMQSITQNNKIGRYDIIRKRASKKSINTTKDRQGPISFHYHIFFFKKKKKKKKKKFKQKKNARIKKQTLFCSQSYPTK